MGQRRTATEAVVELPHQAGARWHCRSGLTEHGLRATFAAEIKRVTGANDDQVAAALGDRDARMGAHYTRHVEQEQKIIYLFATKQWQNRTKPDLENGRLAFSRKDKKPSKLKAKKRKGGL